MTMAFMAVLGCFRFAEEVLTLSGFVLPRYLGAEALRNKDSGLA